MYQEDGYIVLETDRPEEFMTYSQLEAKLVDFLSTQKAIVPRELEQFDSVQHQARHLIDNYFDLDIGADKYLQWYVVRLEK